MDACRIEAEISPATQALSAKVRVDLSSQEDGITAAVFEPHNALNVSTVEDANGRWSPASRYTQDLTVRLNFPEPLAKGAPTAATFYYDGRFTGREESPVFGITFAPIQNDHAFLLYPARWFTVSGYTAGRFSAALRITVPSGYRVVASGDTERARRRALEIVNDADLRIRAPKSLRKWRIALLALRRS